MLCVSTWTLSEIESAVRSSWGPDTVFASADYMARGSGQPSRGQCGTTALVIQSLLGGDLMVADVEYEGRMEGVHYWNVTPGGVELDLTLDQFLLLNSSSTSARSERGGTLPQQASNRSSCSGSESPPLWAGSRRPSRSRAESKVPRVRIAEPSGGSLGQVMR